MAAGVGDARAEHQPDRAEADDRDRVPALHAGDIDAVEAAGERLGHRGDLGGEPRRDGEEVRPRDPLGDEEQLGVGAVQEREEVLAERLLAARAGGARSARRRVGGDHAAAGRDVDPADLVPERARRRAEQHGVPAAVRLEVGAVRERDVDLQQHVAVSRARLGDVLETEIPGPVQPQRSHGVKTTFSASRRRKSSSPSANRSSGRTTGSGTSRSWSSASASRMYAGVADRAPRTVSSRR